MPGVKVVLQENLVQIFSLSQFLNQFLNLAVCLKLDFVVLRLEIVSCSPK